LEKGAAHVVMPDLIWTGGLTEGKKIAIMADAYHLAIAPHDCTGLVALYSNLQSVRRQHECHDIGNGAGLLQRRLVRGCVHVEYSYRSRARHHSRPAGARDRAARGSLEEPFGSSAHQPQGMRN
jgi:hypothetical protein